MNDIKEGYLMPGLWRKRFTALIIDAVIITLSLWIIVALIYPLFALTNLLNIFNIWILIAAIFILVYFTYFEGKYNTTPGKTVMKLKIKANKGKMGYKKSLIRSLSKILWFPLIVDVIIGFVMGSPRERLLDRLAKTEVVKAEEVVKRKEILEKSTT